MAVKEYAISGTATTTPVSIEFNLAALIINFINDGANSIFGSFVDPNITNGFEIKPGEGRTWNDLQNAGDRVRLFVKTTTSTAAYHGEAIR